MIDSSTSFVTWDLIISFTRYVMTHYSRYPLKAVKVMHTVALRTETSLPIGTNPPGQSTAYKVCTHRISEFVT